MTLSRFEFCLSFQINISCCEESFVNVCVHRADRHIKFRVICKDLIRGLPLLNQWRYDLVFLMELVLGHIYSRTRRYQQFTIFSVSSTAVVIVFMCNRAVIYLFRAAIANIWSFVQSFTAFFFKVLAGLITCRTWGTFNATEKDFSTGIGLLTMVTMNAKVLCVIKSTFVIPIWKSMRTDFFRYSCWIFT